MEFQRDFAPKLGIRADGFGLIFSLLHQQLKQKGQLTIVETGCVRNREGWESDGNSTVMFDRFAKETASTFISIDITPRHCALARSLCPHTTIRCADSVATLFRLKNALRQIDLLYLDSFDLDWNNPHPSALHHLHELCAAMVMLKPGSMVFVDDNNAQVGKGMYVATFMEKINAKVLHKGYQLGFLLP